MKFNSITEVRRMYALLFLLAGMLPLFSQPVSEPDSRKAASSFVLQSFPGKDYEVKTVTPLPGKDLSSLVLISLAPEGWILMTKDLRVAPVLGFSFHGEFDTVSLAVNTTARQWLAEYNHHADLTGVKSSMELHPEWKSLLYETPVKLKSTQTLSIEPLIPAMWGQGSGWNLYCPVDTDGPDDHALVGCVAVAMAQAMSVYSFPPVGKDTSSYNSSRYGTLTVAHSDDSLNWEGIAYLHPDTINALLLYHCAVSVSMNFGPESSSASTTRIVPALRDHYLYSNGLYYTDRYGTTEMWQKKITNELREGKPLVYRGSPPDGSSGHAFNIDGLWNNNYFHVNWGWTGKNNGYFLIDNLCPGTRDYTSGHGAIFNIRPMYYPTAISLSDVLVALNRPSGYEIGTLEVDDEAVDNEYRFELICDSAYTGGTWEPDYILEGTVLKTNRMFTASDLPTDTIRVYLTDRFGHRLEKTFVLGIGSLPAGGPDTEYLQEDTPLVYPNPAGSLLHLNEPAGMKAVRVSILTAGGKTVFSSEPSGITGGLDISFLPPGMYILEYHMENNHILRSRFIKLP